MGRRHACTTAPELLGATSTRDLSPGALGGGPRGAPSTSRRPSAGRARLVKTSAGRCPSAGRGPPRSPAQAVPARRAAADARARRPHTSAGRRRAGSEGPPWGRCRTHPAVSRSHVALRPSARRGGCVPAPHCEGGRAAQGCTHRFPGVHPCQLRPNAPVDRWPPAPACPPRGREATSSRAHRRCRRRPKPPTLRTARRARRSDRAGARRSGT